MEDFERVEGVRCSPTVEAFLSTSTYLRTNDLSILAAVNFLTLFVGNTIDVNFQLYVRGRDLLSFA